MMADDIYESATGVANAIEAELKKLGRWESKPLPPEKFENMGAFGSDTMGFTQWIQFVLLVRIREIVRDHDEFPSGSMLAPFAIREFDGDPNAGDLHDLLYQLDELINGKEGPEEIPEVNTDAVQSSGDTVSLGDTNMPEVLYTLAGVLPQFTGDDLENQLQTFDMFAGILSPSLRPQIGAILMTAAQSATTPAAKARIEKAAHDIVM
jgi:uncharacterized protein YqcC (DUF446 family)